MKVKIEFEKLGRAALEIEAESVKEAVELAVKSDENLGGADLSEAHLVGADLSEAHLVGADLRGANLMEANLAHANLIGANLAYANLMGAHLDEATLQTANLWGANLEGAWLDEASLEGAYLRGANLAGAKYGDKKLWWQRPVLQLGPCGRAGRTTVAYFFADGGDPLIRCGCFRGTLEEFRKRIHNTHAGSFHELEYNALAAHIETIWKIQKDELKKGEEK